MFDGIFRKLGTDSYGMSGAVAYAVARGGTCWAESGTARTIAIKAKENRFMHSSVGPAKTGRYVCGETEILSRYTGLCRWWFRRCGCRQHSAADLERPQTIAAS